MSVVVVGLHERDAPLEALERLAIADRDLPKALQELLDSPHLSEAAVLSTCLRTEVYCVLERFHDGLVDIQAFFESRLGETLPGHLSLTDRLFVAYDDAAARHLFEVAAGVDSAVLGEGEILRQVRHALERARAERAAGPVLEATFRHALEVGKRARNETGIARGITSLAHVATALARDRVGGSLAGRRTLVVGAGEMGEGIAQALAGSPDAPEIVIANRRTERARDVAAAVDGRAVGLAELGAELAESDVVIAATSADEPLVHLADVLAAMATRPGRPLTIIDAAVPRDVDPAVASVPEVSLLDVDDLRRYAESVMQTRRLEVAPVEAIVDEELERFRVNARSRAAAPMISALRSRAEALVAAELERSAPRLERLTPAERELVEATARRIVAKLLHEPTIQLKLAAGSARGERLAEALRTLFDL